MMKSLVEAVLERRNEESLSGLKPEDFADRSFRARTQFIRAREESRRLLDEAKRLKIEAQRHGVLSRLLAKRRRIDEQIAKAEKALAEVANCPSGKDSVEKSVVGADSSRAGSNAAVKEGE